MKTILFTLLLLAGSTQFVAAQQLFLKTGATVSNFLYENSAGVPLDNLQSAGGFHFGVGNRYMMNHGTIYFTYGASWNNYGAVGSDARLDNFFEWDLSYAGLRAGLDLKFMEVQDFSLSFSGSIGAEYLVRGTQIINNQAYDIRKSDEYNPLNFMVWGGTLASYELSRKTAICFQYQLGYSLFNLQSAGNDNEQLNLLAHQFSIGFLINISNVYCPF
jgi:hypothetical protein